MGNLEKKANHEFSILKAVFSWQSVSSMGSYHIVKDKITGLYAESYLSNLQNPSAQFQIYQFRANSKKYLPKILSVAPEFPNQICFTNSAFKVVVERIPYRLIDLGHLGYGQGLYIMERSLKGGELIWRNAGSVHFDDTMICFNTAGKSKIWLNENLSKNQPEINVKLSEKEIALEIMTIVQTRMGGQKFAEYMKCKREQNIISFKSAINFIKKMKEKQGVTLTKIILPNENEEITKMNSLDITAFPMENEEKNTLTTKNSSERSDQRNMPIQYAKSLEQKYKRSISPLVIKPVTGNQPKSPHMKHHCKKSLGQNFKAIKEEKVEEEYFNFSNKLSGHTSDKLNSVKASKWPKQNGKKIEKTQKTQKQALLPKQNSVQHFSFSPQYTQVKFTFEKQVNEFDTRIEKLVRRPLLAEEYKGKKIHISKYRSERNLPVSNLK